MIQPIRSSPSTIPPLENGDRLDQKTFHERYEAMPPDTRAELIGGIVYMPSPLRTPHGRSHGRIMHWLIEYEDATPGTEALDNATTILGEESEPQPDGSLIISPPHGQIRLEDEYIVGAPELISEIASSTEALDLHRKKDDYELAGVQEYIVVALRQMRVFWFIRRGGKFEEMQPLDGILRSQVFPGLWLDPGALLRKDGKRMREVLTMGLASPEHAAFVNKLAPKP